MIEPPIYAVEVQAFRPKKLQPGTLPTIGGQSRIVVADRCAFIALGRMWAVLDEDDVSKISGCTWVAIRAPNNRVYVENKLFDDNRKSAVRRLHRVLMDCPHGMYVDHIDCNPLNNRRSNLRICTPQQNAMNTRLRGNNTSGFKGVSYRKGRGKWTASIRSGGKYMSLGCFDTREEAHAEYVKAAQRYFGEFAREG